LIARRSHRKELPSGSGRKVAGTKEDRGRSGDGMPGRRRINNPGPHAFRTDGRLHKVRNPRRVGSLLGDQPGSPQVKTLESG
jgi:hypothetical protein